MISYGYIIVDSCIISFDFNCIMQLKQFYDIATKVSSRKKCYYFGWSTWLGKGAFLWQQMMSSVTYILCIRAIIFPLHYSDVIMSLIPSEIHLSGMIYFKVVFETQSKFISPRVLILILYKCILTLPLFPRAVHRLRPGDINVAGAFGD